MKNSSLLSCDGYKKLLSAVEADEKKYPGRHAYRDKLRWIVARAEHYSEKTGIPSSDILDAWERDRSYWYMNYYQPANQPEIIADNVLVFDTTKELIDAVGTDGFICPNCGCISHNPYVCKDCGWESFGLFGTGGRGVYVFVKDRIKINEIFMSVKLAEG